MVVLRLDIVHISGRLECICARICETVVVCPVPEGTYLPIGVHRQTGIEVHHLNTTYGTNRR